MDTDILHLIGITDPDVIVDGEEDEGTTKILFLEKKLVPKYCPVCGNRMKSKGFYTRQIKHSVLQGVGNLTLRLKERKWHCTSCGHNETDTFNFVDPYKQTTNLMPYMIVYDMKDLSVTAAAVARKYNVSDTYVHQIFMQYVNLPRLPLSDTISIDEVYLNFNRYSRYAMIIMDFKSEQIIDILPNRNNETAENYFLSIPREERDKVKNLVSDMYNPYLNYPRSFFKNARSIVDSFHVIQWINNKINSYITQVKRKYQERDRLKLQQANEASNRNYQTHKDSREVYILKNFKWALLEDHDHINYSLMRTQCRFLGQYLDTYQRENLFFSLDPNFRKIRDEKEKYIAFNNAYVGHPDEAAPALDALIAEYQNSDLAMFREFAGLLSKYHDAICASFTTITVENVKSEEKIIRRLSNGPMESFNNLPKDLKRNSNGVSNFEYTRNRILWATRNNPSVLAIPRSRKEVHTEGKKRGSYNKNK